MNFSVLWRGGYRGDDWGQGDAHQPRPCRGQEGPQDQEGREPPDRPEDDDLRPQQVQHRGSNHRWGEQNKNSLEQVYKIITRKIEDYLAANIYFLSFPVSVACCQIVRSLANYIFWCSLTSQTERKNPLRISLTFINLQVLSCGTI